MTCDIMIEVARVQYAVIRPLRFPIRKEDLEFWRFIRVETGQATVDAFVANALRTVREGVSITDFLESFAATWSRYGTFLGVKLGFGEEEGRVTLFGETPTIEGWETSRRRNEAYELNYGQTPVIRSRIQRYTQYSLRAFIRDPRTR